MGNFFTDSLTSVFSFFCCDSIPDTALSNSSINNFNLTGISKIQSCYLRNVETIMKADGLGFFSSDRGGNLFFEKEGGKLSPEKEEGLELVKQVLRQAWGKVVEAQYAVGVKEKGPMLLEEAIHQVDLLQEKLRHLLPIEEAHKILADEKWARILANNYKMSTPDLIEKMAEMQPPSQDESLLKKIRWKLLARDNLIQDYREDKKKEFSFIPLSKETGGVNFAGTKFIKKGSETCSVSKSGSEEGNWEMPELAWLNELIATTFDQVLGCRFGTATSTIVIEPDDQLNTLHSFKASDDRWHQAFNPNAELKSSQLFVLLNIFLKTQDAHSKNILCRKENGKYIPIPIDFGRLLSPFPHRSINSFLRFTAFINWHTLDQKFDKELKKFVNSLDPNQIVKTMKQLFLKHPSLTEIDLEILEKKLIHLKANILMVQEAIKEDITPKQLVALSTFRLTSEDLARMEEIASSLKEKGSHLKVLRNYMMRRCYCAFLSAWREARLEGKFDDKQFVERIRKAILNIKNINVAEKYFNPAAYKMFFQLYL